MRKPLPTTWKCKDGRVIPIVDLEDDHLVNTILMVRRNAAKKLSLHAFAEFADDLGVLASGLATVHGEGARDALESEIATIQPKQYSVETALTKVPVYVALMQEAEFRSDLREFQSSDKRGMP